MVLWWRGASVCHKVVNDARLILIYPIVSLGKSLIARAFPATVASVLDPLSLIIVQGRPVSVLAFQGLFLSMALMTLLIYSLFFNLTDLSLLPIDKLLDFIDGRLMTIFVFTHRWVRGAHTLRPRVRIFCDMNGRARANKWSNCDLLRYLEGKLLNLLKQLFYLDLFSVDYHFFATGQHRVEEKELALDVWHLPFGCFVQWL